MYIEPTEHLTIKQQWSDYDANSLDFLKQIINIRNGWISINIININELYVNNKEKHQ